MPRADKTEVPRSLNEMTEAELKRVYSKLYALLKQQPANFAIKHELETIKEIKRYRKYRI